jgi:4-diphosphocytidyl-2-C-methyl-D-erythritol kinase
MVGRGEVIEAVTIHDFVAVLILPAFECPTADVYAAYAEQSSPMGPQLDPADLATGLPSAWSDRLTNDLAEPAMRTAPALAELFERLAEAAPSPVHVTGSGSGLFVLFNGVGEASAVAADLRRVISQDAADIVVVGLAT